MDAELLKEVNKVIYFIDEHKKGNPNFDNSEMKVLSKSVRKNLRSDKHKLIHKKLQMFHIKLKLVLTSYETIVDDRFADLSNYYLMGISDYLEYISFLSDYLIECEKKKEYDTLDDACLLAVDIALLVQQLELYMEDIYKVYQEDTASYTVVYPKNDYKIIEETRAEAEQIMLKLKKDPE